MATITMSIFGGIQPDTSGSVSLTTLDVLATNDFFKPPILEFEDTATKIGAHGTFEVPENYVGTPVITPVWSSSATSGDAVWDFDYRAIGGDDAESLDQATAQEALTVTDAAPSASHERNKPTMSATGSNLAAGDTVEFIVSRDGASADTIAASIYLIGLLFTYNDA